MTALVPNARAILPADEPGRCAIAFGLRFESDLSLRQFAPLKGREMQADIAVRLRRDCLPVRHELMGHGSGLICADGYRFRAGNTATLDLFGTNLIEVRPGPDWQNELPAHFYSTVLAVALAAHGLVPLHGTAIAFRGDGILICGHAGAGKSSLGAALIALGGTLVSDDLSALKLDAGNVPVLVAGRPDIRLYPQAAAMIPGARVLEPAHRGKQRVLPPETAGYAQIPLRAVIMLDDAVAAPSAIASQLGLARLLQSHLFRPWLMRHLPGQAMRTAMLLSAASHARAVRSPPFDVRTAGALVQRARETLEHALARHL